jgi:hypothetical protein
MRKSLTLATLAAGLTLASTASAQVATAPVPIELKYDPVAHDIQILDAAGTVRSSLHCQWDYAPEADDKPCMSFVSDPKPAFDAIEAAGGVEATWHTTFGGGDVSGRMSKRADGTWLIRSRGVVDGRDLHFGRVCNAEGTRCVRWDADGARAARKKILGAAAKLR